MQQRLADSEGGGGDDEVRALADVRGPRLGGAAGIRRLHLPFDLSTAKMSTKGEPGLTGKKNRRRSKITMEELFL